MSAALKKKLSEARVRTPGNVEVAPVSAGSLPIVAKSKIGIESGLPPGPSSSSVTVRVKGGLPTGSLSPNATVVELSDHNYSMMVMAKKRNSISPDSRTTGTRQRDGPVPAIAGSAQYAESCEGIELEAETGLSAGPPPLMVTADETGNARCGESPLPRRLPSRGISDDGGPVLSLPALDTSRANVDINLGSPPMSVASGVKRRLIHSSPEEQTLAGRLLSRRSVKRTPSRFFHESDSDGSESRPIPFPLESIDLTRSESLEYQGIYTLSFGRNRRKSDGRKKGGRLELSPNMSFDDLPDVELDTLPSVDIGGAAVEWLQDLDRMRAKSGKFQGRISSQMKIRANRTMEAIRILVARAEAKGDVVHLKKKNEEMTDELRVCKRNISDLKKEVKFAESRTEKIQEEFLKYRDSKSPSSAIRLGSVDGRASLSGDPDNLVSIGPLGSAEGACHPCPSLSLTENTGLDRHILAMQSFDQRL